MARVWCWRSGGSAACCLIYLPLLRVQKTEPGVFDLRTSSHTIYSMNLFAYLCALNRTSSHTIYSMNLFPYLCAEARGGQGQVQANLRSVRGLKPCPETLIFCLFCRSPFRCLIPRVQCMYSIVLHLVLHVFNVSRVFPRSSYLPLWILSHLFHFWRISAVAEQTCRTEQWRMLRNGNFGISLIVTRPRKWANWRQKT